MLAVADYRHNITDRDSTSPLSVFVKLRVMYILTVMSVVTYSCRGASVGCSRIDCLGLYLLVGGYRGR